jgi:hypothetical protein
MKAINFLDISYEISSINNYGMLMYQLGAYFTYKRSQMGENVNNSIFTKEALREKFFNNKNDKHKVVKFVCFHLPYLFVSNYQ